MFMCNFVYLASLTLYFCVLFVCVFLIHFCSLSFCTFAYSFIANKYVYGQRQVIADCLPINIELHWIVMPSVPLHVHFDKWSNTILYRLFYIVLCCQYHGIVQFLIQFIKYPYLLQVWNHKSTVRKHLIVDVHEISSVDNTLSTKASIGSCCWIQLCG